MMVAVRVRKGTVSGQIAPQGQDVFYPVLTQLVQHTRHLLSRGRDAGQIDVYKRQHMGNAQKFQLPAQPLVVLIQKVRQPAGDIQGRQPPARRHRLGGEHQDIVLRRDFSAADRLDLPRSHQTDVYKRQVIRKPYTECIINREGPFCPLERNESISWTF